MPLLDSAVTSVWVKSQGVSLPGQCQWLDTMAEQSGRLGSVIATGHVGSQTVLSDQILLLAGL